MIKDEIQNDEAGFDDDYENYDTEEFSTTFTDEFFNVPDVKTEEIENIDQLKAKSLVKLFKLDQFLLDKLITAEKGFLKTRFLTSIVSKQEQAEKAIGINEPVELKNGSFMCHLCLKVLKTNFNSTNNYKYLLCSDLLIAYYSGSVGMGSLGS